MKMKITGINCNINQKLAMGAVILSQNKLTVAFIALYAGSHCPNLSLVDI